MINSLLAAPAVAAELSGMPGVDPSWSRLVQAVDAGGVLRTWHVLDNDVVPQAGTLLCVHGNPTWSYLWRRYLACAEPGWRVVAVDQLGMGYSERPTVPRSLAARIDDLDAVTAELGISGRVVLAAHDWGGPISLGWALRHRHQIAGLILTNTGVAVPSPTEAPALIRLVRSRALRELVCVRTATFVRAAALSRPPIPVEVRNALHAPYLTADRRRAIGDFVADIPLEPSHPSRSALDHVAAGLTELASVPTLLLWGPRDPVFTQVSLRDLQRRLPHADVQRYPRASHLVVEDAPRSAEDAWSWVRANVTTRPQRSMPEAPRPEPTPDLVVGIAAGARSDDPAIAELGRGDTRVTSFAELENRVEALADGLRRVGVRPGHRVALLVPPGLDLTTAVYACWQAGAAIVVADAGLGWRRMADALRSADPAYLIGIPAAVAAAAAVRLPGIRLMAGELPGPIRRMLGVAHSIDQLAAPGDRGSVLVDAQGADADTDTAQSSEAAVLFTSGATGPPKGVVYRHHQLRAQLDLLRTLCGVDPSDRLVAAFAPFALYGPALGIGAAVPQMDVTKPGTLTAPRLAEAASAIDGTLIFASPAALRNVVATAGELSAEQSSALARIRLVLSAGAPVSVPLLRRLHDVLPSAELHTPYGMTEALPLTDISLPELEEAGSGNGVCVGRPLPGVQLRISPLDSLGRALGPPTDEVEITGEICVSAAHVKDRYDRLWATERASSRDRGWHRSGDVGHLDRAGRLWVEGRLVHVITTADGPLTPVGVEQRIEAESPVTGAAVVGVGPPGTQQVVAVVVPGTPAPVGLARPELASAVRAAAGVRLAAVLGVDALPVDIRHAAKIDRQRLARWAERVLAGARVGRP
ncbi:MAG TPA: alpha/beta fold hydrolase [Propionibacteriaceae bacterium]|nr:alpha/beta fold hydrolase [Propionibacteriaceae bacterium]